MNGMYFAFGVHGHQPIGNHPRIFEECYRTSYAPFFKVLENFPELLINVHLSGSLLEWLLKNKPEFIGSLQAMIDRGQIEILGGPLYEPVLPLIPEPDITEQILLFTKFLAEKMGVHPRGMWLPERVWESYLAKPIAMAGIEYTLVDNCHFNGAGWMDDKLHGYFITEHEGFKLKMFPILESLRYKMPYSAPAKVIEYIKKIGEEAGGGVRIMIDDIEKFGAWPGSYKHTYEDKWLENFFTLLKKEQKAGNISTIKLSDYTDKFPSDGNIYLPARSYSKMGMWALPCDSGNTFRPIYEKIKETAETEKKPWMNFICGGIFQNMLIKYPESNLMHKKMLKLSREIINLRESENFPAMQRHLFRGQCNCAYWHGIFGGIYMGHLRAAVFHELLECEKLLYGTSGKKMLLAEDDSVFYGQNEIDVCTENFSAHIHPDIGANVSELSEFKTCHNLGFVMKRRKEVYHTSNILNDKIVEPANKSVKIKDAQKLTYDWYDRFSFIFHFFHPETRLEDFAKCTYGEQGDFVNQPFKYTIDRDAGKIICERTGHVWEADNFVNITVTKTFEFFGNSEIKFLWKITNNSPKKINLLPGIELNLSPSSQNSATFSVGAETVPCTKLFQGSGDSVVLEDKIYNLTMKILCSKKTKIWLYPVETVCLIDTGFESLFQGVSLTFLNRVEIEPGRADTGTIRIMV
ncbi:MAG: alpha-amylase/4-alpha-glucanotransferase domain-containing protein [bacterium]